MEVRVRVVRQRHLNRIQLQLVPPHAVHMEARVCVVQQRHLNM
jgi:hypothetical protein